MNNIYDFDFSRFLPGALTHDPKMVTLAKMLAAELLTTSGQLDNVLIYSRFDELPEELVDVLAYDMHVDWYDYSYPLKVKRDLVKNSVKVHKKMGTKYAVETALGSLWPQSEIEEWFNYGGEPHHFRVICDVTEDRITASFSQLVNAVKMYKRLSSHLESVVYQTRISCIIQTHTDYVVYKTPKPAYLQQQSGFSYAGVAAYQHKRPFDQAAAQNSVKLGDPSIIARFIVVAYLGDTRILERSDRCGFTRSHCHGYCFFKSVPRAA